MTQSVTLASEACIQGVPTLLISKAKRGFLDFLESNNYPLIRCEVSSDNPIFNDLYHKWLGLVEQSTSSRPEWINTMEQWASIIGN